jgi:hypothetical protein
MITPDSESDRILPRQYSEAEMVQVRLAFQKKLANYPVNKKFRMWVIVPLMLVTMTAAFAGHYFPVVNDWSRWVFAVGMLLFFGVMIFAFIYWRKKPLPCPCCGKNLFELGKFCPQCHDPSLIHPRGDNPVRCIPCNLNFWGQNWRIKYCTHCGAHIHEAGFCFGGD